MTSIPCFWQRWFAIMLLIGSASGQYGFNLTGVTIPELVSVQYASEAPYYLIGPLGASSTNGKGFLIVTSPTTYNNYVFKKQTYSISIQSEDNATTTEPTSWECIKYFSIQSAGQLAQTACGYSTSLLTTTYFWVKVARQGDGDLATDMGFQYTPLGCSDLQTSNGNVNCPTTSAPTSQQATWGICQTRSPTCEEPCFVTIKDMSYEQSPMYFTITFFTSCGATQGFVELPSSAVVASLGVSWGTTTASLTASACNQTQRSVDNEPVYRCDFVFPSACTTSSTCTLYVFFMPAASSYSDVMRLKMVAAKSMVAAAPYYPAMSLNYAALLAGLGPSRQALQSPQLMASGQASTITVRGYALLPATEVYRFVLANQTTCDTTSQLAVNAQEGTPVAGAGSAANTVAILVFNSTQPGTYKLCYRYGGVWTSVPNVPAPSNTTQYFSVYGIQTARSIDPMVFRTVYVRSPTSMDAVNFTVTFTPVFGDTSMGANLLIDERWISLSNPDSQVPWWEYNGVRRNCTVRVPATSAAQGFYFRDASRNVLGYYQCLVMADSDADGVVDVPNFPTFYAGTTYSIVFGFPPRSTLLGNYTAAPWFSLQQYMSMEMQVGGNALRSYTPLPDACNATSCYSGFQNVSFFITGSFYTYTAALLTPANASNVTGGVQLAYALTVLSTAAATLQGETLVLPMASINATAGVYWHPTAQTFAQVQQSGCIALGNCTCGNDGTNFVCTLTGFHFSNAGASPTLYLFLTPKAITGPWSATATVTAAGMLPSTQTLSVQIVGLVSFISGPTQAPAGTLYPSVPLLVNMQLAATSDSTGSEQLAIPADSVQPAGLLGSGAVYVGIGTGLCNNFTAQYASGTICPASGGSYLCPLGHWNSTSAVAACVLFVPTITRTCNSTSNWLITAQNFVSLPFSIVLPQVGNLSTTRNAPVAVRSGVSVALTYSVNVSGNSTGGELVSVLAVAVENATLQVGAAGTPALCANVVAGRLVCYLSNSSASFLTPVTSLILRVLPKQTILGDWNSTVRFSANCFDTVEYREAITVLGTATLTATFSPLVVFGTPTVNALLSLTMSATPVQTTYLWFNMTDGRSILPVSDARYVTIGVPGYCDTTLFTTAVQCNLIAVQQRNFILGGQPLSMNFTLILNSGYDVGDWPITLSLTNADFQGTSVNTTFSIYGNLTMTLAPGSNTVLLAGANTTTTLVLSANRYSTLRGEVLRLSADRVQPGTTPIWSLDGATAGTCTLNGLYYDCALNRNGGAVFQSVATMASSTVAVTWLPVTTLVGPLSAGATQPLFTLTATRLTDASLTPDLYQLAQFTKLVSIPESNQPPSNARFSIRFNLTATANSSAAEQFTIPSLKLKASTPVQWSYSAVEDGSATPCTSNGTVWICSGFKFFTYETSIVVFLNPIESICGGWAAAFNFSAANFNPTVNFPDVFLIATLMSSQVSAAPPRTRLRDTPTLDPGA